MIGEDGGGYILLQLARALTGLTLVATASRNKPRRRVQDQGSYAVIDHTQPWAPQLRNRVSPMSAMSLV